MRPTYIARDLVAGCFQCWGSDGHWFGKNAQGVAARHHDATGHTIRYGHDSTANSGK